MKGPRPLVPLVTLLVLLVHTATADPPRVKRFSTTFVNPHTLTTPPPLKGKGRECKSQADCEVIQYTRCSLDHRDNRKRCICRDSTPPVNGQCVNRPRDQRSVPVLFLPASRATVSFFPVEATRPVNATLPPLFRPAILGLRELCNTDAECLEGAECKINPNITHSNGKLKYCLCRAGHLELDNACNGCERQSSEAWLAISLGATAIILTLSNIYVD